MVNSDILRLKKALLSKRRSNFEKLEQKLIKKYGYSKYRDVLKESFKEVLYG
jgi:hypothetical protein